MEVKETLASSVYSYLCPLDFLAPLVGVEDFFPVFGILFLFEIIDEKTGDGSDEDLERHDTSSETDAYALADLQYPGKFGVFYKKQRASKNDLEQNLIKSGQEKTDGLDAKKLIAERFKSMR